MRGRRLWCKVDTSIGPMAVYVVLKTPKNEDGDDCDALYDSERHELIVRWVENKEQMKKWLLHELIHIVFMPMRPELREKIFGKDPEEEREELVTQYLEPGLYDLMTRNRWLRLPDPPRFT